MIKKLLLLVVVLVLLLGAAIVIVPSMISPETIKAQLIERVNAATGRKLTIEGKLALKVFPFIGVDVEKVSLSNPAGFDDKAFVSVGAMQVNVALMPLLQKDIQVNSFVLKEPVIRLAVNKAGKGNWDFAPAEVEKGLGKTPLDEKPKASKEGGFLPSNLRLSDIEIQDGSLFYTDAKGQQKLEKLNAKVNLRDISAPLDVKADALWQGKTVKVALNVGSLQGVLSGKASTFAVNVASDVIAVDAKGNVEGQNVTAKAGIQSSSLKALAKWLNPKGQPMATPATLALDTAADVKCAGKACALSNFSLALDNIKATGDAKLNMAGAVPALSMHVKAGELDFNPFMEAAKHASAVSYLVSDAEAAGGHWSNDAIDLSGLKAADVDAVVETTGIVFRQFKIGATTLKAVLKGGKLTADVKDAVLYDGTGSIRLVADGGVSPGAFELHSTLKGIALEPLLKDAAAMDRLSGKADIDFSAAGRGRSQADIISSLGGNGKFSVANGQIQRVNLLDLLHNISGAAGGGNGTTQFTQMGGSFTIAQGVITNNDLLIALQGARVNGQGNVNLPAYTINYRLTPQTYSTKDDATTGKTVERAGVQVPILISGSLDGPSFQPDVRAVLTNALSDPKAFKESLKNSRGDIKEQLKQPKDAIKSLKGLFKKQ